MKDSKLNAWIAEHVMGYTPVPRKVRKEIAWADSEGRPVHNTNFTSDMNSAIQVMEKLNLELFFDEEDKEWCVNEEGCYIGCATSPAMAVCLAAYALKTEEEWSTGKETSE